MIGFELDCYELGLVVLKLGPSSVSTMCLQLLLDLHIESLGRLGLKVGLQISLP